MQRNTKTFFSFDPTPIRKRARQFSSPNLLATAADQTDETTRLQVENAKLKLTIQKYAAELQQPPTDLAEALKSITENVEKLRQDNKRLQSENTDLHKRVNQLQAILFPQGRSAPQQYTQAPGPRPTQAPSYAEQSSTEANDDLRLPPLRHF